MKSLICKECGAEREVGRRLCKSCNARRVNSYPRYTWTKICSACNNSFEAWRKTQVLCKDCYELSKNLSSKTISTNNYVFLKQPGKTEHRVFAESILGRKLQTNEIVHHVDDNPKNNSANNLMVLDRRAHGRLHKYLDQQRVILEKSSSENFENCWEALIAPITTTWLETTGVKVIKIWEIGLSAAEPLTPKGNEEGSETMHETSDH